MTEKCNTSLQNEDNCLEHSKLFFSQSFHVVEQFLRFAFFDRCLFQLLGPNSHPRFISFDLVLNGISDSLVLLVPEYRFQFRQFLFSDSPAHLDITVFQIVCSQLLIAYRDLVNKPRQ